MDNYNWLVLLLLCFMDLYRSCLGIQIYLVVSSKRRVLTMWEISVITLFIVIALLATNIWELRFVAGLFYLCFKSLWLPFFYWNYRGVSEYETHAYMFLTETFSTLILLELFYITLWGIQAVLISFVPIGIYIAVLQLVYCKILKS